MARRAGSTGRSLTNEPRDLRALVSHVNQRMVEASPDSSFVTMFYAEYDEAASVLRYVNAGHNPPMLLTDSQCKNLSEGGTVVGLFRESVYELGEVALAAGDVFMAYTDGLLEARNPQEEEIGEERLSEWLTALRDQSAEAIKQRLLEQVAAWTENAEQEDDLTLLVWRKR